ncbi:MAG: hypothetical protein BroJett024_23760 [Alphaproteobacteria bacterium]|nr:MAG: hypothetical protein BroJett024_23760 [Alphaproteobacteria bacterium]
MVDVSDTSSNRRDQIANFAEILLNSPARQRVFKAVYRGKKGTKTIGEIATATGYSPKRVAEIAHPLARGEKLFEQDRERYDGKITTVYKKIPFVTRNKQQILSKARDRCTLSSYHTKTNPKINLNLRIGKGQKVSVKVPFRVRSKFIRIEDVKEFSRAKSLRSTGELNPSRLSEAKTKAGILRLLGETKTPKDWGGENNDIFTDRVTLFGKRRRAAFALKGPAKTGALVPGKMGKNGDQIQRLFDTPASVFIVQYEGEVKESIYKLMEELAKARAITGGEIFWCVIDGDATKRLRKAYARVFR